MILEALQCIQRELDPSAHADIGSVGEIINGGATPDNNIEIIISLINVEENRISRDPRNHVQNGTNILMKNPAVHLNLTLLFTAINARTSYQLGMQSLQQTIRFFQSKYVFDHTNTSSLNLNAGIEKLVLEMVSLNLEQLNHLWAILGGRYQPSVVYKMRMVTIDTVTNEPGHLIKEIESRYFLKWYL